MPWSLSLLPGILLLSAGLALAIGLVAYRNRPDAMAWPLTVLMLAVAAWSIPQAISLGSSELEQVVFWHRLRYPGIAVAPVAYLVLALRYAGYDRWLNRRSYGLLAIIPVVSTALVWTNPSHGLQWASLSVIQSGGVSVVVETPGPWQPINFGVLYLVTTASLTVLGMQVLRSHPIYRKQAVTLFAAGLIPLATNVAVNLGLGPETTVDLTAPALALTGSTIALALFRFDLLEIRPIARDRLVDQLEDGVVVIGPHGRVRDFNPMAARILDDLRIDQPGEEVLPPEVSAGGEDLLVETTEGQRWYRARSTRLGDGEAELAARIIKLDDISDLVQREQRITVLNRILRHNIRNELNEVAGRIELLETADPEDRSYQIERAHESLDRVIEFADKARFIERNIGRSDAPSTVSASQIAKEVVDELRRQYGEAVIEYPPEDAPMRVCSMRVVDAELVRTAIAELVENGIVHNDQDEPRVVVDVERDRQHVHVSVADNGPGIPESEKEVLSSRSETGLSHSSGLGLWLVEWAASLSSGEVAFSQADPRGTVVTLSFPAAEH